MLLKAKQYVQIHLNCKCTIENITRMWTLFVYNNNNDCAISKQIIATYHMHLKEYYINETGDCLL